MNLSKKLGIAGASALIIGASGVLPVVYFAKQERLLSSSENIPLEAKTISVAPQTITGKPVRIQLPSLGIDLAVGDGAYNSKAQTWTLSKTKAYYAMLSVPPNNAQGNTLVYGHAIPNIFAPLSRIQPQTTALITTDNGYVFTYSYNTSIAVKPTNSEVFNSDGQPRLTLQTCSGYWSQNRQLYGFDLVSVVKV